MLISGESAGRRSRAQNLRSPARVIDAVLPDVIKWPIVLRTMRPSEIAGVAIITSFMSFLASCFMSGVAEMTDLTVFAGDVESSVGADR